MLKRSTPDVDLIVMKMTTKVGALTISDFRSNGVTVDERRREQRVACTREIQILPCSQSTDEARVTVSLLDCSPRGLGILADVPMQIGDQFIVNLQLQQTSMVLYTVRRCTALEGKFRIGAELDGLIGGPDDPDANTIFNALTDAAQQSDAHES